MIICSTTYPTDNSEINMMNDKRIGTIEFIKEEEEENNQHFSMVKKAYEYKRMGGKIGL